MSTVPATTTPAPARPRLRRPAAAIAWAIERPVLTAVLLALLVRVCFAIASFVVNTDYLIPDEVQYIDLARVVVGGHTPEEWFPGYGQSLYDSTGTFMEPLVALFRVFGTSRLVGQLFSAVVGAAVVGGTTFIALRFLRRPYALLAGAVVALMPSQVLFSAVVLREAHVWLGLCVLGIAAVLMAGVDRRRIVLGAVIAAAALFALAYLRQQTFVTAAWSLALAMLIAPRQLWPARATIAVAMAVAIPWIAGIGPAGLSLVDTAAPNLAKTRSTLATGANSAFQPPAPTKAPPASAPVHHASGATGIAERASETVTADDSLDANLSYLPQGIVDVSLRPFPWNSTEGITLLFARLENIAWYVLYVLGVIGLVAFWRDRRARAVLGFPLLTVLSIVGVAALTQGNLGTAFRHREQILWALALFAAAGAQRLADRRALRRSAAPAAPRPAAPAA
ncbi:MAG: hypothetical protein JWM73_990 [Solirubrobacterales bacterium]|nr:hypothetical protein [Solirubrobacterales bacterium]